MGYLLKSMGRLAEAERYYREALEGRRRVLGDDHPRTLQSLNNMGGLLAAMGKFADAEPYVREALESQLRVLGNDHPETLNSIHNVGSLLQSMGRYEEAEPYYREALEGSRRVLGDDHPLTLNLISRMGWLFQSMGKLAEAKPLLLAAVDGARRSLPPGNWRIGLFLGRHGKCLTMLKRYDDAEAALLEAYEILEAAKGAEHKHTAESIQLLIDLYDAWHAAEPDHGYDAKAAQWRAKLEELQTSQPPIE
jgi:non-specific serine/threonine protein kinase/serine/threonine-protein kinase